MRELEKISSARSVLRTARDARRLQDVQRLQGGNWINRKIPFTKHWTTSSLLNKKKQELKKLRVEAENLSNSADPSISADGIRKLKQISQAEKELESGVRPSKTTPRDDPSTKPKESPPKKATLKDRFDRLANITGKATLGVGALGGAYKLYESQQNSSPYGY